MHDLIRPGKFAHDPEGLRTVPFQLHERGLAQQVAAEKHPVADLLFVEVLGQLRVRERRRRFHPEHEAEPGTVGAAAGGVPGES